MKPTLLAIASCLAMSMPATAVVFNLDCALGTDVCTALPEVVGTVTVTDTTGGVAVNVVTNYGPTYKDLYFNLVAPATLTLPALYVSDGFQLVPFGGYFDVGTSTDPNKGFDGTSNIGFVIYGNVTAEDFKEKDSLGLVYVGIHLQDISCTDTGCFQSGDSLKVGASLFRPPDDPPEIPEPATYVIVGLGLTGLSLWRHRRA